MTWTDYGIEPYKFKAIKLPDDQLSDIGILIGRFEPLHNGHLDLISFAYSRCKKLIILVGSARNARDHHNPFSFEERQSLILEVLKNRGIEDISVCPIGDHTYIDTNWIIEVQDRVEAVCEEVFNKSSENLNVKIFGHYKDRSSYYLNIFPDWEPIHMEQKRSLDATDIRVNFFLEKDSNKRGTYLNEVLPNIVPEETIKFLINFINNKADIWSYISDEWIYGINYIKDHTPKGQFVFGYNTVDAVVINNGYVLLIKRKHKPGQGRWALPGGFIKMKQGEDIHDAVIRELVEETKIGVSKGLLENSIKKERVFGNGHRSFRGYSITLVKLFAFKFSKLPEVKGADDAEKAKWFPLAKLPEMEDQFFEDHYHIIKYMTNFVED